MRLRGGGKAENRERARGRGKEGDARAFLPNDLCPMAEIQSWPPTEGGQAEGAG